MKLQKLGPDDPPGLRWHWRRRSLFRHAAAAAGAEAQRKSRRAEGPKKRIDSSEGIERGVALRRA